MDTVKYGLILYWSDGHLSVDEVKLSFEPFVE